MDKDPTGMEVDLRPGHSVLDVDPAPLPQKGEQSPPPIFGPRLLWKTAAWIKMRFRTEVGLGPGSGTLC